MGKNTHIHPLKAAAGPLDRNTPLCAPVTDMYSDILYALQLTQSAVKHIKYSFLMNKNYGS